MANFVQSIVRFARVFLGIPQQQLPDIEKTASNFTELCPGRGPGNDQETTDLEFRPPRHENTPVDNPEAEDQLQRAKVQKKKKKKKPSRSQKLSIKDSRYWENQVPCLCRAYTSPRGVVKGSRTRGRLNPTYQQEYFVPDECWMESFEIDRKANDKGSKKKPKLVYP